MQILHKYGSQRQTHHYWIFFCTKICCVEYCSVHFLRKFYASMVPSDEPKKDVFFLYQNLLCRILLSTLSMQILRKYGSQRQTQKGWNFSVHLYTNVWVKILVYQIYICQWDRSNPIYMHRKNRGPYRQLLSSGNCRIGCPTALSSTKAASSWEVPRTLRALRIAEYASRITFIIATIAS